MERILYWPQTFSKQETRKKYHLFLNFKNLTMAGICQTTIYLSAQLISEKVSISVHILVL